MRWPGRELAAAALLGALFGASAMADAPTDQTAADPPAEHPIDPPNGTPVGDAIGQSIDARLDAVARTEVMIDRKLTERRAQLRARACALYKLARAGDAPLWLDPAQRGTRVRWRGAARRILGRDLYELSLLREEMGVASRARARLEAERARMAAARQPGPGSLARPVPGAVVAAFGPYRHRASGATLSRRGVLLASRRGREVRAVAGGQVVYAGPLRGLGQAVVIEHHGVTSVLARLARVAVSAGDVVTRGAVVARAAGDRVQLEIRVDLGVGGEPIDPAPLLER